MSQLVEIPFILSPFNTIYCSASSYKLVLGDLLGRDGVVHAQLAGPHGVEPDQQARPGLLTQAVSGLGCSDAVSLIHFLVVTLAHGQIQPSFII